MSYQIKSTSYIQRMPSKSKQNDQLQMLQKEYERMNFLNESKIEMKMRQVRLNRLFKEIEQIKKFNLERRHRMHPKRCDSSKTKETERLQIFKKAKNLGQYFSQRNLRETNRKRRQLPRKSRRLAEAQPETSVLKRIKYGNEISNWNMQNIQHKNACKEFRTYRKECSTNIKINFKNHPKSNIKKLKKTTHFVSNSLKNKEVNTTSKIQDNSNDCINLHIDRNGEAKTSVLTLSGNVHLIDLEICDKMHEAILTNDDSLQVIVPYKSPRAVKNWQKLATLIRDKSKIYQSNKVCEQTDYETKHLKKLNNKQLESSEFLRNGRPLKSLDEKFSFTPNLPDSMPDFIQNSKCLKPLTISANDMYYPGWEEKHYSSKFSVGKLRRVFENSS
ncbi:uncharacterized protein LOC119607303 [Lucilia sericata]|uniref:uncharacterized protein LOC119607303 n=1 Tax=Lucilia sericata TaxID=13632 RepID=UPI0018A819E3|nr:uncharacterized protein LOC119607303 [Lucilia sericata]